ncbi:hypothetical protein ACH48_15060 [Aeromonas caviae]|nr:hypothetical protein ACH48_15060 [Aeromonas caviae]
MFSIKLRPTTRTAGDKWGKATNLIATPILRDLSQFAGFITFWGAIGAQGELRQAGTAGQQLLHGGGLDGLLLGDQLHQACNQRIAIGEHVGNGGLFLY